MALTKVITGVTDLNQDDSTNGLKFPTGSVFAGTPEEGMIRNDQSQSSETSSSTMQFYNGTAWKNFVNIAPCTTDNAAFPITNLAYYKLNNNANDSGLGSGYIGQGGIFNGSSSIVTLPSALSDGTTTDAVCISFWFNVGAEVTSSTTDNEIMTFAYSGGSFGKIALGSTTGNFSGETFSVSSDLVTQYTYSKTNIPAGWNHAVVQWNSGWNIYINGVAHTTYTFGTNEQGKWALKFGQRSSYYYNGILDQVRIFPTVLSSSNIALLYAETSATSSTLNYPVTATALYEFSGNADSTSSSAYNGTATNVLYAYNGTPTNITYAAGKFGDAAVFNGSTSSILLSNTMFDTAGVLSVSVWFKTTEVSGYGMVLANRYGTHTFFIELYTNGTLQAGNWGGSSLNISTTSTVTDGNWHHYAYVNNSGAISVYLDGALENTGTQSFFSQPLTNGNQIGNWDGSNSESFDGQIDQMRIFSSALNAAQVTQLYNEIQC